MKICKFKGPRGECGALSPVRPGRDGFDLMCIPDRCERFTPATNLDRVRAMDVPELVELLLAGCDGITFSWECWDKDCDCHACLTAWLAAEAEEEET